VTRAELAAAANEAVSRSRKAGAPLLSEDSGFRALLDWCNWNDPGGEWLDGETSLNVAWDAIECMLSEE